MGFSDFIECKGYRVEILTLAPCFKKWDLWVNLYFLNLEWDLVLPQISIDHLHFFYDALAFYTPYLYSIGILLFMVL
jgi:hypothetical protein